MSSIDFSDYQAVEAFADEVDSTLDARAETTTPLWSLIATWVLAGILLTLGYRFTSGVLYVLGILVVIGWVTGIYAARQGRDFVGD